jgi:hypothetical protein
MLTIDSDSHVIETDRTRDCVEKPGISRSRPSLC